MAIAVPLKEGAGPTLKQRLARAERVNRFKAQALIAPLALFLLLVFLVPIAALQVVVSYLLAISKVLGEWDETPKNGELLTGFLAKLGWWLLCANAGYVAYTLEYYRQRGEELIGAK